MMLRKRSQNLKITFLKQSDSLSEEKDEVKHQFLPKRRPAAREQPVPGPAHQQPYPGPEQVHFMSREAIWLWRKGELEWSSCHRRATLQSCWCHRMQPGPVTVFSKFPISKRFAALWSQCFYLVVHVCDVSLWLTASCEKRCYAVKVALFFRTVLSQLVCQSRHFSSGDASWHLTP